ncbi:MAG: hypothetical protein WD030_08360 [Pirellulales bacterium]
MSKLTAEEILDREYLQIRAWLLQVAAAFDRIDRAGGDVAADPRLGQFSQALEVLAGADRPKRAEEIQLIFSRHYKQNWREELGVGNSKS